MKESKLIYIASPYAGDIEKNVVFAQRACRYAIHQGYIPIAVHLLYPQMLDDGDPAERESSGSSLDNSFCGGAMNCGCAVTGSVPAWHGKFPKPIS